LGGFEVRNNIATTLIVCIALLRRSVNFKGKMRQSRAIAFTWNARRHGVSEELITFIAPSSSFTQSVVSGRHVSHAWKSVCPAEVSVTDRFYENFRELCMRKQCDPGSIFSAHAQEPGNEARKTKW